MRGLLEAFENCSKFWKTNSWCCEGGLQHFRTLKLVPNVSDILKNGHKRHSQHLNEVDDGIPEGFSGFQKNAQKFENHPLGAQRVFSNILGH